LFSFFYPKCDSFKAAFAAVSWLLFIVIYPHYNSPYDADACSESAVPKLPSPEISELAVPNVKATQLLA